ncbi:GNAT family N-acetyltransferase [Kribbella sp. NBC_00709]|uniref:GNAT family N-acetyltransferase n=1 Tax=Kribbella sp. NBC_00709 TaxID=2975972 RepID=UPI002E2DCBF5|nr:GNAT family N-acetyltransferase [Kribbella sp. NBC_00709]
MTRTWVDDARRLAILAEEHAALDILLAEDLEIAAQRAERLTPGQPAESLLNRWVAVGNDLHAMLSLRFEGMDVTKPFVDATPMTRSPLPPDLPALAAAARDVYGIHNPQYVRVWSAEPDIPGTQPDRRFLAAPISDLQPHDVPPGLALTPASTVDHYDEARQAYDAVDAEHPHHADEASLQDRDDLEEAAAEGLLFDITANGDWAGYAAAVIKPDDALGLPAYVVLELILAEKHRGHGYGQHLSTLLARALPDPTRILIGTIHALNHSARTAAEKAGRQDIGGWRQLPLPHP